MGAVLVERCDVSKRVCANQRARATRRAQTDRIAIRFFFDASRVGVVRSPRFPALVLSLSHTPDHAQPLPPARPPRPTAPARWGRAALRDWECSPARTLQPPPGVPERRRRAARGETRWHAGGERGTGACRLRNDAKRKPSSVTKTTSSAFFRASARFGSWSRLDRLGKTISAHKKQPLGRAKGPL